MDNGKRRSLARALLIGAFLGTASLFGGCNISIPDTSGAVGDAVDDGGDTSEGGGEGGGEVADGGNEGEADAPGTSDLAAVSVMEARVGDGAAFNPAVSFFVSDEGGLSFTVAGVDANGDNILSMPSISDVNVQSGDQVALTVDGTKAATIGDCETTGISGTSFDIAVSMDTTGSMGSASGIIAQTVADFATALGAAGIDAKFAGITTGDAYATKSDAGSPFDDSVSRGSLGAPPVFDNTERPDTGDALLSAGDMATFFNKVNDVVASGAGGGDGPENYLGPVRHLNDTVAWRPTASRVIVSIGDNCAHVPGGLGGFIEDPWTPPAPADLEDALSGVATVHVIGNSEAELTCVADNLYNMKALSDATGGTFQDIGNCGSEETCNVDLNGNILTSATSSSKTECQFEAGEDETVTLSFTVSAEGQSATYFAVLILTRN